MSVWITMALGVGLIATIVAVFAIPIGVGVVAASIADAWRSSTQSVYVGVVERGPSVATGHDTLQVRAYVDETLVDKLPAPSTLIGRMFIRETNTSVPLTFARVPPYVPPKSERSAEWQESVDVPVVPVIFSFDARPNVAAHPGQLVDVCIAERWRASH
jgi:HlyD family secretion protein